MSQWYTAVITSVEDDDSYLVTFDGYGNQEVVGLGDMMLPTAPKKERTREDRSRYEFVIIFTDLYCHLLFFFLFLILYVCAYIPFVTNLQK